MCYGNVFAAGGKSEHLSRRVRSAGGVNARLRRGSEDTLVEAAGEVQERRLIIRALPFSHAPSKSVRKTKDERSAGAPSSKIGWRRPKQAYVRRTQKADCYQDHHIITNSEKCA